MVKSTRSALTANSLDIPLRDVTQKVVEWRDRALQNEMINMTTKPK
jgi:hypothetical protein